MEVDTQLDNPFCPRLNFALKLSGEKNCKCVGLCVLTVFSLRMQLLRTLQFSTVIICGLKFDDLFVSKHGSYFLPGETILIFYLLSFDSIVKFGLFSPAKSSLSLICCSYKIHLHSYLLVYKMEILLQVKFNIIVDD